MSYRRKKIKSKIHKIKPKKNILRCLWFWLTLLFTIIFIILFYFLFFYQGFQVENILISGNQKVSNQELENVITKNSTIKLISLGAIEVSTRSIFLINIKHINEEVIKEFPIIEKLQIKKKFPKTLILEVIERDPVGIYCSNNNECFLIDKNGVIFEPLTINFDNLFIIKKATIDENTYIGNNIFPKNIIEIILKIQSVLKEKFQINIKEALLVSPIRLDIKTNENWKIFLNIENDSDINLQVAKLILLLSNEIDNKRSNLHYIDLRYKDRAIICDNDICKK